MANSVKSFFKSPGGPGMPGEFVNIVAVTADYTMSPTDTLIVATISGAGVTVTLPDAAACAGRKLAFKTNTLAGQTLTLACHGSQKIDGNAPWTMTDDGLFLEVISDGANWIALGMSAANVGP